MTPESNPADDNAAKRRSDRCGHLTYIWYERKQPTPATPCPDCRGRGSIELLISTQPCLRYNGSGSLPLTCAVESHNDGSGTRVFTL